MDEEPVKSVAEYARYVSIAKEKAEKEGNSADLLFRGQPCDDPLIPRLGRLKLRGELANVEKLVIEEFKRTSVPLTEFEAKNDWDVVALAQHHGLPTRLLDWTQSAFAGLWFAVKDPPRRKENGKGLEPGYVWIFSPRVNDYRLDTDTTSPFDNRLTKIFRPKVLTRRISAQSGVFTAHKIVDGKRFIALEKNKTYKDRLFKLKILPNDFAPIRKELQIFGVNAASLFPDLDGLSKHLEWRYSWYRDEK